MTQTLIDSGAYRMAINALRRAGKAEIADELELASKRGVTFVEACSVSSSFPVAGNNNEITTFLPVNTKLYTIQEAT